MNGDRLDRALRALGEETLDAVPAPPPTAWFRLAAGRRAERRRVRMLSRIRSVAAALPAAALAAGVLARPAGALAPLLLLAVPAALGVGYALSTRRQASWPDDLAGLHAPSRAPR